MTAHQALELHWLQDVNVEPAFDSQVPPAPAASLTEPLFQPSSYISPRKDSRLQAKRPGNIVAETYETQITKAERPSSLDFLPKEVDPGADFDIEYELDPEPTGANSEFLPSGCQLQAKPSLDLTYPANEELPGTSPDQTGQRGKNHRDRPQTRVAAQPESQERITINGNNISPQATILNQQYKLKKKLPRKLGAAGQSSDTKENMISTHQNSSTAFIKLHQIQLTPPGGYSDNNSDPNAMLQNQNENYFKISAFRHKRSTNDFSSSGVEFGHSAQFPRDLVNQSLGNFSLSPGGWKKQKSTKERRRSQ